MRIRGRRLLQVASALTFGLITACTAPRGETTEPRPAPVDQPTQASSTTTTTTTSTAATSTAATTVTSTTSPITSPPSTTSPTTTIDVERVPLLEPGSPIESVGIFGDSLVADLTAIGGRDNQVVPQLTALLVADGDLDVERVENLAVPGQAVISDLGLLPTRDATIGPYVERMLLERPGAIDLALVAISSSDINLNASLPEPVSTDRLARQMLAELRAVEGSFRAADVEVVFIPIFGINDAVFSDLRCALAPTCPPGPDAQIEIINGVFWDSGLPMLFEQFGQLDADGDGDGRTDRAWFEDVDPRFPDDGIHPNADGQAVYSTTVADALTRQLTRRAVSTRLIS